MRKCTWRATSGERSGSGTRCTARPGHGPRPCTRCSLTWPIVSRTFPRVLGYDDQGREVLSYLPGRVLDEDRETAQHRSAPGHGPLDPCLPRRGDRLRPPGAVAVLPVPWRDLDRAQRHRPVQRVLRRRRRRRRLRLGHGRPDDPAAGTGVHRLEWGAAVARHRTADRRRAPPDHRGQLRRAGRGPDPARRAAAHPGHARLDPGRGRGRRRRDGAPDDGRRAGPLGPVTGRPGGPDPGHRPQLG